MRRCFRWLIDQLLPPACPLCRRTLPHEWSEPFCGVCLVDLQPLPAARCSCCALPFTAAGGPHLCGRCSKHPPPFSRVHAAGCYQQLLREAIARFKFHQQVNLDRPLAGLLAAQLPADLDCQLLVPVPLHRRDLQQRSYNQALLLARELGRCCGLPVAAKLLLKPRRTQSQHQLSARQRERNLRQAFRVSRRLDGERILLVDDVLTTGSTARACSRVLREAGAGEIQVAVLARA